MTRSRFPVALCTLVCAVLALAPAAGAAGPPLPSSASGRVGVVAPRGHERLLTRPAGRNTLVVAVRRGARKILRSRQIAGRWTVPAVTLDNATTGLSADGGTLVLARPTRAFPPKATRLAVVDSGTLALRRTIALNGFFTVDAISPDGSWIYVIQYPGEDILEYRVRALDSVTGRLGARDVVDPRKPDEQMGGLPMTRALSRDGRWAYTLYGGGAETFIHALDTVGQTAACIDLGMLAPGSDLSAVRLSVAADGRHIDVRDARQLVASVDAQTFAVSAPQPAATARGAAATRPPAASGDAGFEWLTLLLVGAGIAGVITTALILHRRSLAVPGAAR